MTSLEKLDEVIRLTVMVARCAEPTTTDYKELTERRNALVHELRAALGEPMTTAPKPPKCPRCLGEKVIDQTGYGEYRPCPDCNPESPYYVYPTPGVAIPLNGQENNDA